MNIKPFLLRNFLLLGLLGATHTLMGQNPQLGKDPIEKVIAAMTLEEKAGIVVGGQEEFHQKRIEKEVAGAVGITVPVKRLGVPSILLTDGPAGVRIAPNREGDSKTYYCTAYPIETALASSWNTQLVEEAGRAIGEETLEYGLDVLLAPALNIHRHPFGGRNFEYYSEDPLISGKMAAAMVNGVQSKGVGATIKHFAANNQELKRKFIDTRVSQRALREIYLRGFEIAVKESNPWAVMTSYNKINGVYASESEELTEVVLRKDWGFKGMVMTDWAGGVMPQLPWRQMVAGHDLLMEGSSKQVKAIIEAVKDGTLDVAILDRNVRKMLELILKTPRFKGYKYSNTPDLKAHAQISRHLAGESIVLLKNEDKALPLNKKVKKISAFGINSYEFIAGGTGSGGVNKAYTISLMEGLDNGGYNVNAALEKAYKEYIAVEREKEPMAKNVTHHIIPIPEMVVSREMIAEQAKQSDIAFISIGRVSGEARDRILLNKEKNTGDYLLTDTEKDLLKNVSEIFHSQGKKVVLVLNIGSPVQLTEVNDLPDAIVLAWQLGIEGGNAVTDVLSGKVNPSGRLVSTFLADIADVSAKSFPGTPVEAPTEVTYNEGVYVGYRYYDTFGINPLYEFGYGLSYSDFAMYGLKITQTDNKIELTAKIKNIGTVAGKEVAQIYISAPKVRLDKPAQELKAFGKTKELKPGEVQELSFTLNLKDLASFNEYKSAWVVEPGNYEIRLSKSSRLIQDRQLITIPKEIIVETVSDVLKPEYPITEIKATF